MEHIESNSVKKSEIMGHAIAGVGQNLIFGIWSSYMLIFYTDVFGISAAAAGMIMMLTRVWDAVNDPLMGMIADNTKTRWGRYRPWLLFMAVPIGVFLVLNFSTPNLPSHLKIVYAAVTYVAMSMAFTAIDVPYWTMPAAMTLDSNKRAQIYTSSRIFTTISSILIGVLVIPLVNVLGNGNMSKGFQFSAILIAVIGTILYLIGFKFTKEHIQPQVSEKFRFSEAMKVIIKNKPLLVLILTMIVSMSSQMIKQNLTIYYVQYNLGSLDLVPIVGLIGLPGMFVGMGATPVLSRKIGKKLLFISVLLYSAAISLIMFFIGYSNIPALLLLFGLSGLSMGSIIVLLSAMIADTIEYAEWKTGQRREGLISSTQTFATKICIAIGGGLSGLILTVSGYVPNQIQTAETMDFFHFSMTLLCAIGFMLAIIPMLFHDLSEKKHLEIVNALNNR